MPFRTARRREDHFYQHGAEVGATDEFDYEHRAEQFLTCNCASDVRHCVRRSDGAVVRWNTKTQEFGILSKDGYVMSYFVPDPKHHRLISNRAYFENQSR